MAVVVVKAAAFNFGGGWAPKNQTVASLTGGTGANGLLVWMFVGQGGKTIGSWQIPDMKYGGLPMAKLGYSLSPTSNGGSMVAFYIENPPAAGDVQMNTATDFYVDAATFSYAFVDGVTGVGTATGLYTGHTVLHQTSVPAPAGSAVITNAIGVYMPSMTLTASTPTATVVLNDSVTKSDLAIRMTRQEMATAGNASVSWQPPYNEVNSISVVISGEAAGPTVQTVTTAGSTKPVTFGAASVVRLGPQTITANGSNKPVLFGQATVGAFNMSDPLQLVDDGRRFTVARTAAATYITATETLAVAAAGAPRMGNHTGVGLGIMAEPAGTNYIADNTGAMAVVAGAYPSGGNFYNGGAADATCVVAAKGVEDGYEYVDLQFAVNNTTGAEVYPSYSMTDALLNSAAPGETWTLSAFARIVAGNHVRSTDFYPMVSLGMNRVDATGGYVSTVPGSQALLQSDKLHRHTHTAVIGAGAAIAPLLALAIPAGRNAAFTVRLALPQLERSPYPTSPIKTDGALGAVTRPAESVTAILDPGTYAISVERTDIKGLRSITTYAEQVVPGTGLWPVPAVADAPFIRRISTGALVARAKAKTTAAAKGWSFGTAFSLDDYNSDTTYATLIKAEAASYGAEYELKPDQVQPTTEGTFAFTVADAFVARAVTDGVTMRGHALVWYAATPTWMQTAFAGATTTRWQQIIDNHIAAVITRWPNLRGWDVVNEVLEPADGLPGGFRNWSLYGAAGSAYIAYAFQRARFHAPNMDLYICEYGLEENDQTAIDRRTAMLNLLTSLVNAGVPVTGLSIQCHLDLERPFSRTAFNAFLTAVRALGLKVIMTELDVRAPADDTALQYDMRAAYRVREVLDVLMANTTGNLLSTWNLRDQYTWLDELGNGRTQRPLPFETTANTPKAMYAALQEAFEIAPPAVSNTGTQNVTTTGKRFLTTFGPAKLNQTVKPAGANKTVSFGTAALSSGPITISPAGFKPLWRWGQASLTLGNPPIRPSGLAIAVAFGPAKLNQTVKPAGATKAVSFGPAKLGQVVRLGGSNKAVTFGTAMLRHNLKVTGFIKSAHFGNAKMKQSVRPPGLPNPVAFGPASVLQQGKVQPAGFTAPVSFGTAQLLRASQIGVNGFTAPVAFGAATMRPVAVLRPSGLAATTLWGVPSLGQSLRPAGLQTGVSFGAVTVARASILNPPGFSVAVAFGAPALPQQVRAVGGTSFPVGFGSPTILKTSLVAPAGLPVQVRFGPATVLPEQIVAPQSLVTYPAFGVPALRQSVRPAGFQIGVAFGAPSLPQRLRTNGTGHGVTFGTAIACQNVGLDPVSVPVLFGSPAIRSGVAPAPIQIGVSFGAPTLKQQVRVSGHEAAVSFGTISMPQAGLVYPPGIDITVSFGPGEVRPEQVLRPAGFSVAVEIGQPEVLQNQPVIVHGFNVLPRFGDIGFLQRVLPDEYNAPVNFGPAKLVPTQHVNPAGHYAVVRFGAADIAQGANIRPGGINAQVRFSPATVLGQGRIEATGQRHVVQFGAVTLLQSQIVSPAGFQFGPRFGDATLRHTLTPAGFRPVVLFGTATALPNQIVRPVGLPVISHFGVADILRQGRIATNGHRSALNFGKASVSPVQSITPAGWRLLTRFGEAQVANGILVYPSGWNVPVSFGSATVEVETDLFVGSLEIGVTFGSGRVAIAGQDYAFVKMGDEWATILEVQVKVDGEWKEVESVLGKVDGSWEIAL